MNKIILILFICSITVQCDDQVYWLRIKDLVCRVPSGSNVPLISDEKLALLESQCKITKEKDGPISTCAPNDLESGQQLLGAFCDDQTFKCIQNKPLLSESELQSAESPEQLKQQLVDCIENVIKYNHYLFDDKINFN